MATQSTTSGADKPKMPGGIPYIIGNEAAERFSYYGMRTILVIFMTKYLVDSSGSADAMTPEEAKVWYHSFSTAVYAFPILGALLSDIFWGKYKTIMALSVVYCLGHLSLAFMDVHAMTQLLEPRTWLALGLGLIAVGSGGIKPCVSAHVGDQFKPHQKTLLDKIFSYFYFSINFGAFLSTLATPWLLQAYGPAVAFGIPGLLMFIATYFFWIGRTKFTAIPSVAEKLAIKDGAKLNENFMKPLMLVMMVLTPVSAAMMGAGIGTILLVTALALLAFGFYFFRTGEQREQFKKTNKYNVQGTLDFSKEVFSKKGLKALFGLGVLYVFIAVFWCLFDQTGSSWVLQADNMNRWVDLRFGPFQMSWLNFELLPSQIQALNPLLILSYIPLFNFVIYPLFQKFVDVTPLRKIGAGFFLTAISFAIIAQAESLIEAGQTPSIMWQFVAYAIITAGEVLISITALEFSYTQAPHAMKSIIMGVFLLSVSLGNTITAIVNSVIQNPDGTVALTGTEYYMFFTQLVIAAGVAFIIAAKFYKEESYIQDYEVERVDNPETDAEATTYA